MNKRIVKKLLKRNAIKVNKLNIQAGQTVVVTFDPNIVDAETSCRVYRRLEQEFPDVNFVGTIKGIKLSNKSIKLETNNFDEIEKREVD